MNDLPYSPPPGGYRKKRPGEGKSRNLRKRLQLYRNLVSVYGFCPCFVCGLQVELEDATIEHVIPIARGGRRGPRNCSISHAVCNMKRGAPEVP